MFDNKQKSILEALETIRLNEGRANDDSLANQELDEAEQCIKQAIRHLESAQNYSSIEDKNFERAISIVRDTLGDRGLGYDAQPRYSIEYLRNMINGVDDEGELEESDNSDGDFFSFPYLQQYVDAAFDKSDDAGSKEDAYESLEGLERIAFALACMNYQVTNGGWEQFIYNGYDFLFEDLREMLADIYPNFASQVDDISNMFWNNQVWFENGGPDPEEYEIRYGDDEGYDEEEWNSEYEDAKAEWESILAELDRYDSQYYKEEKAFLAAANNFFKVGNTRLPANDNKPKPVEEAKNPNIRKIEKIVHNLGLAADIRDVTDMKCYVAVRTKDFRKAEEVYNQLNAAFPNNGLTIEDGNVGGNGPNMTKKIPNNKIFSGVHGSITFGKVQREFFDREVKVGSRVTFIDALKDKQTSEYTVTDDDSKRDASRLGYIHIESPLGAAILGKKRGEQARVKVPNGEIIYIIDKIR